MAAPINLEMLDPPILEQTQFGPDMDRWITNIVDIINASFMTLNQALAGLIGVGQSDIGGSGAGPISVTVTGLMSTNYVAVTLVSSTNPVTILSVVAGSGSFDITFNADPGASAIIAWQAFVSMPQ